MLPHLCRKRAGEPSTRFPGFCLNTISCGNDIHQLLRADAALVFLSSDYATRLTDIKNKTPGNAGRFISS
jgi:hypothetical protein